MMEEEHAIFKKIIVIVYVILAQDISNPFILRQLIDLNPSPNYNKAKECN